jgi:hypothetical protein
MLKQLYKFGKDVFQFNQSILKIEVCDVKIYALCHNIPTLNFIFMLYYPRNKLPKYLKELLQYKLETLGILPIFGEM